jgi:uncharacterized heparinase superfamily protein
MLSTGAALFGRDDFKARAGQCWEETFWFLGPRAAAQFDALPSPQLRTKQSRAFPRGGFFVLRDERSHVIVDCGNVGMRGIGGHGHNDILSFELVLDGVPIVTDCGAYLYTASREWRNKFRSTAFHATMQVGDEEINRFISPMNLWQLHDDAQPAGVEWYFDGVTDRFTGSHTGYLRLANPVKPSRSIALLNGRGIVRVIDRIEGSGIQQITWRFPIEPGIACALLDGGVRFTSGADVRWLLPTNGFEGLDLRIEPGWVSPSYGVKHETSVVTFSGDISLPRDVTYSFSTERSHS